MMGIAGALVWCVSNDTWIPFRLDAVKLSGDITKAHWESVAELVRLLASNQLVLRTGSTSNNSSACSSPSLPSASSSFAFDNTNTHHRSSPALSPLLEDVTANIDSNSIILEETLLHAGDQNDGNDNIGVPHNTSNVLEDEQTGCSHVEGDSRSVFLFQHIFGTNSKSTNASNANHVAKNTLSRETDYDRNMDFSNHPKLSNSILLDLKATSLENVCSENANQNRHVSPRSRDDVFSKSEKVRTSRRRCSMPSLDNNSSNLRHELHSVTQNSDAAADDVGKKTNLIRETGLDESRSTDIDIVNSKEEYTPQETPNWLKLLQRYHDSKRLEKQIQRQREAWARNKRNLRRESVPKCMSGLSRYVFYFNSHYTGTRGLYTV